MTARARWSTFVLGMITGLLALAAYAPPVCGAGEYFGVNTVSRHVSPARDYNERNWGLFYERRDDAGEWGWQTGFYENSYAVTTLYSVGIYQPWKLWQVRVGGFAGPASGYSEKGLVLIGGAVLTWEPHRSFHVQVIANPAVVGLQFKGRF